MIVLRHEVPVVGVSRTASGEYRMRGVCLAPCALDALEKYGVAVVDCSQSAYLIELDRNRNENLRKNSRQTFAFQFFERQNLRKNFILLAPGESEPHEVALGGFESFWFTPKPLIHMQLFR